MSIGMRQFFKGQLAVLAARKDRHSEKCAKGISDIDEYRKTVGRIAGLDEAILALEEYYKKYGEDDDE